MYQAFMLFIRRTIGIVLLLIGLIGLFIPLVPIWMSLIPGIALLGAKDPLIRSLHLKWLRILKSIKHHKTPWIRHIGLMTYTAYRRMQQTAGTIMERWAHYTTKRSPEM